MNTSLDMFPCRREIGSIYKTLYWSQWKGREQSCMSPQFSAPAEHHHSNGPSTPLCSQPSWCRLCLLHTLWSNHCQYRCMVWLFLQISIWVKSVFNERVVFVKISYRGFCQHQSKITAWWFKAVPKFCHTNKYFHDHIKVVASSTGPDLFDSYRVIKCNWKKVLVYYKFAWTVSIFKLAPFCVICSKPTKIK